jgi:hypothetical protein
MNGFIESFFFSLFILAITIIESVVIYIGSSFIVEAIELKEKMGVLAGVIIAVIGDIAMIGTWILIYKNFPF